MRVSLRKRRIKSGGYVYIADYRLNHKRFRQSLETSNKSVAQNKCEEIERSLLLGAGSLNPEKRNMLVSELAEEYQKATSSRRRPKTNYEEMKRFEKSILPAFGHLKLSEVNQRQIEFWINQKKDERLKPGTINRHITSLKAMFNRAVDWEYIPKSPMSRIQKLKEPEGSDRFLSIEEAEKLLETCKSGPVHLYPLILLALHTGMRKSELFHLSWKDFDFQRNEIHVRNSAEHTTKSGKNRIVPITEKVREYFWAKRGIGYLFVNSEGKPMQQLRWSFDTACKKAGIENFRFHDLRHTYASQLAMGGAPQRVIQELLGHGSGRMTERYCHPSNGHIHAALKDFSLGFSVAK